jgi:Protein of unknown function (DUF3040)
MALSRRERRVLHQLGRMLAAEDPELVAQLSAPRGRAVARRVAMALSGIGAVVLLIGVVIPPRWVGIRHTTRRSVGEVAGRGCVLATNGGVSA